MIVLEENKTQRRQRAKACGGLIQFFCLINRCSILWDSVLIVITVPFLSKAAFNYKLSPQLVFGVMTPSLLDCLNKRGVRRDNKWTKRNMQGTCSPFWPRFQCRVWPLRRAILTAVLLHHKVPTDSNPLRCLQGVFILADLRVDFFIFPNIGVFRFLTQKSGLQNFRLHFFFLNKRFNIQNPQCPIIWFPPIKSVVVCTRRELFCPIW